MGKKKVRSKGKKKNYPKGIVRNPKDTNREPCGHRSESGGWPIKLPSWDPNVRIYDWCLPISPTCTERVYPGNAGVGVTPGEYE